MILVLAFWSSEPLYYFCYEQVTQRKDVLWGEEWVLGCARVSVSRSVRY